MRKEKEPASTNPIIMKALQNMGDATNHKSPPLKRRRPQSLDNMVASTSSFVAAEPSQRGVERAKSLDVFSTTGEEVTDFKRECRRTIELAEAGLGLTMKQGEGGIGVATGTVGWNDTKTFLWAVPIFRKAWRSMVDILDHSHAVHMSPENGEGVLRTLHENVVVYNSLEWAGIDRAALIHYCFGQKDILYLACRVEQKERLTTVYINVSESECLKRGWISKPLEENCKIRVRLVQPCFDRLTVDDECDILLEQCVTRQEKFGAGKSLIPWGNLWAKGRTKRHIRQSSAEMLNLLYNGGAAA